MAYDAGAEGSSIGDDGGLHPSAPIHHRRHPFIDQPLVIGEIASGYAKQIRQGLRQALRQGVTLGGLRPATKRRNAAAHAKALQQAVEYRDVLKAGHDKSLSVLARDLFAAGCCTRSGKPLTPEMVRRLRIRLQEAGEAVAVGDPATAPAV